MFPWEYSMTKSTYNGWTHGYHRGISPKNLTYTVYREYLNDSPHQAWRKGDIVKFHNRLVPPHKQSWTDWFATKRDQKKFWNRIPEIAKYADNQLAMVVGRFRKIKLKWTTFTDYGIVTMMLTGPKAGKLRHYWSTKPFDIKCRYPNTIKFKYMLRSIPPEVVSIYNQVREDDSNEIRNQLCHEIFRFYNEG